MTHNLYKDADSGDPYACLALAYFKQTGKEMDENPQESIVWYERAAALGCARAHWELSKIYRDGDIVEEDIEHSLTHLMRSAEIGNADAQMTLGDEYLTGEFLDVDINQTFRWYLRAAEQGISKAKFAVGYMYAHGMGVERSKSDAEIWFSSAAITGHADLFQEIGMRYEYGIGGICHNEVEAARWYKYGADMGHEKCILCLTSVLSSLGGESREPIENRLHRLSLTVTQREIYEREETILVGDDLFEMGDDEGAYRMYTHAAKLGHPKAMFLAAMMKHEGIGVKRDDIGAIKDLSRAADAGSEDAQFYLARTYESSKFPTDDTQIVKLYSDAAYNGFLAAYYYLSKYVDRPEIYARRMHARN